MGKWMLSAIIAMLCMGCRTQQRETPDPREKIAGAESTRTEMPKVASRAKVAEKLKTAFIYIAPPGDVGWSYAHDQGRKKMLELCADAVEKADYEIVADEGKVFPVIEKYAEAGYHVVFPTSYGYMEPTLEAAKKYPQTVFMHCSGHKTLGNMGTYFGRIYQADYLCGLVAGKMTKNGKVGYVAPHPIPEVIRGINAFALGVRKANPNARVFVMWVHAWYNPGEERACAETLMALKEVDVIAHGQDSPAVLVCAAEEGIWGIGYNTDMTRFAPVIHLTSAFWDWSKIYTHVVRSVKDGTWTNEEIWWGIDTGIVDIAPLHEKVPADVRKLVEKERQGLVDRTFDVFYGPIRNQQGEVIVENGKDMSDRDKLEMLYFVEGVVGDIPPPKGLGE